MPLPKSSAFSLTELLIAVLILGEIATFTIPKVLTAQQNSRNNAVAKEAAGMVSEAWQAYRYQNSPGSGTGFDSLTPYLNYVAVDNASYIDNIPTYTDRLCGSTVFCLRLHNGAVLWYLTETFGGTDNLAAIRFSVDPDGKNSPTADALQFFLYYNGRIRTWGSIEPNTKGSYNPNAALDPAWFSWN